MSEVLINGHRVLVDEIDLAIVGGRRWIVSHRKTLNFTRLYVVSLSSTGPRTTYLHRAIMKARSGEVVDHRNHDGLDNRRENLRIATPSQNVANMRRQPGRSSRFKGVSWNREKSRWESYIEVNGTKRRLGYFRVEADAARAYDAAALDAWGEFAWVNLPTGVKS